MTSTVAFDRVGHVVRVPVQLGADTFRVLVDTGIGISVVSSAPRRFRGTVFVR